MLAGFALFGYLPLHKRTKAVGRKMAAQKLVITKASAEKRQLPELKEQLLKLQEQIGNYEANLPEQRALGVFLQRLSGLMNEHNLKEQVIQPGQEIKADELNCIPVDLQCKGKLAQVFEFYKSLQGLGRLVRIEQVKLVNGSDLSGEVTMQSSVVVYYRPQANQG